MFSSTFPRCEHSLDIPQTSRFLPSCDLPPGSEPGPFPHRVLLTVTGRSRGLRCLSCWQKAKSTERSRQNELQLTFKQGPGRKRFTEPAIGGRQGQTEPQMLLILPLKSAKSLAHDPLGFHLTEPTTLTENLSFTFIHSLGIHQKDLVC